MQLQFNAGCATSNDEDSCGLFSLSRASTVSNRQRMRVERIEALTARKRVDQIDETQFPRNMVGLSSGCCFLRIRRQ